MVCYPGVMVLLCWRRGCMGEVIAGFFDAVVTEVLDMRDGYQRYNE